MFLAQLSKSSLDFSLSPTIHLLQLFRQRIGVMRKVERQRPQRFFGFSSFSPFLFKTKPPRLSLCHPKTVLLGKKCAPKKRHLPKCQKILHYFQPNSFLGVIYFSTSWDCRFVVWPSNMRSRMWQLTGVKRCNLKWFRRSFFCETKNTYFDYVFPRIGLFFDPFFSKCRWKKNTPSKYLKAKQCQTMRMVTLLNKTFMLLFGRYSSTIYIVCRISFFQTPKFLKVPNGDSESTERKGTFCTETSPQCLWEREPVERRRRGI